MASDARPQTKLGPGEYRPDLTEGMQRVEDLPQPKLFKESRNYEHRACPRCGRSADRNRTFQRRLYDTCTCAARSRKCSIL